MASSISPYWLEVEAASSRFRSRSASAIKPATTAVTPPTSPIASKAPPGNIGATRISRIAPAATRVAECSSAETGVGPAMARCNQSCNGTCADLPIAPTSNSNPATSAGVPLIDNVAEISEVPAQPISTKIPR